MCCKKINLKQTNRCKKKSNTNFYISFYTHEKTYVDSTNTTYVMLPNMGDAHDHGWGVLESYLAALRPWHAWVVS
jgi:hypothetical protein